MAFGLEDKAEVVVCFSIIEGQLDGAFVTVARLGQPANGARRQSAVIPGFGPGGVQPAGLGILFPCRRPVVVLGRDMAAVQVRSGTVFRRFRERGVQRDGRGEVGARFGVALLGGAGVSKRVAQLGVGGLLGGGLQQDRFGLLHLPGVDQRASRPPPCRGVLRLHTKGLAIGADGPFEIARAPQGEAEIGDKRRVGVQLHRARQEAQGPPDSPCSLSTRPSR